MEWDAEKPFEVYLTAKILAERAPQKSAEVRKEKERKYNPAHAPRLAYFGATVSSFFTLTLSHVIYIYI